MRYELILLSAERPALRVHLKSDDKTFVWRAGPHRVSTTWGIFLDHERKSMSWLKLSTTLPEVLTICPGESITINEEGGQYSLN